MRIALVTVVVAFIYGFLLMAAVGIIGGAFGWTFGDWGWWIFVAPFVALLIPSFLYAKRYVAGLDEQRQRGGL